MTRQLDYCQCGSGEQPEAIMDGYGIFLCYACSKCRAKKLSRYRKDIFERYECDEPIDNDDYPPTGSCTYPMEE